MKTLNAIVKWELISSLNKSLFFPLYDYYQENVSFDIERWTRHSLIRNFGSFAVQQEAREFVESETKISSHSEKN